MVGAKKMERDVGLVAHHPAVVAWPNVEKIACLHLIMASIVHLARGRAGNDEADVFHFAGGSACRWADVLRPFPTRLVTGAANRHRADLHDFEITLFERPHLIGMFETLDQKVVVTRSHP